MDLFALERTLTPSIWSYSIDLKQLLYNAIRTNISLFQCNCYDLLFQIIEMFVSFIWCRCCSMLFFGKIAFGYSGFRNETQNILQQSWRIWFSVQKRKIPCAIHLYICETRQLLRLWWTGLTYLNRQCGMLGEEWIQNSWVMTNSGKLVNNFNLRVKLFDVRRMMIDVDVWADTHDKMKEHERWESLQLLFNANCKHFMHRCLLSIHFIPKSTRRCFDDGRNYASKYRIKNIPKPRHSEVNIFGAHIHFSSSGKYSVK